jgi:hypothetical protein
MQELSALGRREPCQEEERPEEAQILLDLMAELSRTEHHDRWVEALEGVPAFIAKGLSYVVYREKRLGEARVGGTWGVRIHLKGAVLCGLQREETR